MIVENYFSEAKTKVKDSISKSQKDIEDLASSVSEIMLSNGIIHLFGVNHDRALSMELGFRAGGLVQYHQMKVDDTVLRKGLVSVKTDQIDFLNKEGLAQEVWDLYEIDPKDALIICAINDVYNVTIDLAKIAKANGHPVYLITSKNNVVKGVSKENALKLLDIADKTLDLHIDAPDLFYDVNGVKVTQIANLIVNMYAQALTMEIYKDMKSKGEQAPVLWSMNIKGADEHNKTITEKFEGRWNS